MYPLKTSHDHRYAFLKRDSCPQMTETRHMQAVISFCQNVGNRPSVRRYSYSSKDQIAKESGAADARDIALLFLYIDISV